MSESVILTRRHNREGHMALQQNAVKLKTVSNAIQATETNVKVSFNNPKLKHHNRERKPVSSKNYSILKLGQECRPKHPCQARDTITSTATPVEVTVLQINQNWALI